MTQNLPSGRVETLTADQEKVFKEIWGYFLHFWGYSFDAPISHVNRSGTTKSTISVASKDSKDKKKKRGLVSRFSRGHKHTKSIENELEKTLSNRMSSDPNVTLRTNEHIHAAFTGLDAEKSKEFFWSFLRQDTPDNLLLRFVRARKWDTDKALEMIANTLSWRANESKVDKLLMDGELVPFQQKKEGLMLQFELGKAIIRGYDKTGRPVVIVRPRFHHSSQQTQEEMEHFTLLVIEYARLFLNEPIDSCSILFDLSGFSMSNMDYAPVKFMIQCFEAHYPESLGVLFVHKAPWIFSSIWNVIKAWLDPVVASKIVFTKNTSDLEKVIDIKHIPKELGGDDDFEWKYLEPTPSLNGLQSSDNDALERITQERKNLTKLFLDATVEWVASPDKESSAKALKKKIELGKKISDNYRELDGHIRNRNIYDRIGTLKI
ncbi:unnamed protein product [Kuraishia capsulata CBS 1993]|uniref:CRAL-TRIO domain-containing protein n=1 Tax=Kuraishia capsulata CBS 1993 TaxID=1382522 RepID=W6MI09_9ASCO|nr:uncharacterized protein KUCA_T00001691001 [Kuraishia capsulata CBS 1993]CDK25721.1 unnamed protein product [Kuraishia capsulata CBS 1993]